MGIGRYISGLLPRLATLLGSRLVVFAASHDAALVRALIGGSARLEVVDAGAYRLGEQTRLLAALVRAHLALVHFPHYNLPLGYRGRFVVTIHDLFSYRFPDIHSGPVPRTLNRVLIRNAVNRAAAIITPSAATAAELADRFPSSRSRTLAIPEAADARFSAHRNPQAEAAWQQYLGIRPPYVLYLGQWKAYKNVIMLIHAFDAVRRHRADLQLVLAGGDPRHPEIPAAASNLPAGSVVLPGRLSEEAVPDVYRGAAVVAVPSLAEGFGLPVLEAMACGVPVVCSDIPVLREMADGVAVFCKADDATCFSQALLEVLDPPIRDHRRQLGIERARTFSWSKAADETLMIYERALAG